MDNLFINSSNPAHDRRRRHYGFFHFLGDVFMTLLTSGLWLIWVFCREMRSR